MTDLKLLVRKRGSLKAAVTNFNKFVESKEVCSDALTQVDIIELQDRIARFETMSIDFNELQNEIEACIEEDNLDGQYAERAAFDDSFSRVVARAKGLVQQALPKNDQSSSSSASNSRISSRRAKDTLGEVKLPDIPLPKFQGSYETWLEFRDTFESLIHEQQSLAPIQKYHYLRASLEGPAAQVIKSIEFTIKGYDVAWDALCERYNNNKLLVHNHVKAIFSLEPIIRESSSGLRKLIDDLSKHLRSIEQLSQSTQNWDALLIYLISSKLDSKSLGDWERNCVKLDAPTLKEMKEFLRNRANLLETIECRSNDNENMDKKFKLREKLPVRSLLATGFACYYCKKDHSIYTCEDFLKLSVAKRGDYVEKAKLCHNCLRDNHDTKKCRKGPCRKCNEKHNSLLHTDKLDLNRDRNASNSQGAGVPITSMITCGTVSADPRKVILSTAQVQVVDKYGKAHNARLLLDCGSQTSFITSSLCNKLELNKTETHLSISGISEVRASVKAKCEIEIRSYHCNYKARLTCFVLPNITNYTPGFNMVLNEFKIPCNMRLADPEFCKAGSIDILVGADLFWELLGPDRISLGKNQPMLQSTTLGWIVTGVLGGNFLSTNKNPLVSCHLSVNNELDKVLAKFWDVEEVNVSRKYSAEELECEKGFIDTTRREPNGRFIVRLPLKEDPECLGDSRGNAERRFYSTERKLGKNESLKIQHVNFMREYLDSGHMSLVPEAEQENLSKPKYFMPHHGVVNEASKTTKYRVVFDASAPSSNGLSLNSIQCVGPVLQDDLLSIILRFRKHQYVVCADITKMYRQVLVDQEQRDLQQIVWRENTTDKLEVYKLNTITYGQASASYLAIRCLVELANECEEALPEVARIIRHDFYVDDLLTGSDSLENLQNLCAAVSRVLRAGCFELRKWYSSDPQVLKNIESNESSCGILEFSADEKAKTLGLTWSCHTDELSYHVDTISSNETCTKRSILSLIGKIFDPLGLLSPFIILAKIIMQELWLEKTSWDSKVPTHISVKWNKFKQDLPNLNNLAIKRHAVCQQYTKIELHGFADASERAYGACIYLRSQNQQGEVHINLLCAKSKVSPIKTLTIPRLELCAALLLSRLVDKVIKSLDMPLENIYLWSDSSITLAWIATSPHLLKIFVGNRVAEIQGLTQGYKWQHISSENNPADLVSRGVYAIQLLTSSLWWQGPAFLLRPHSEWPQLKVVQEISQMQELKPQTIYSGPALIENNAVNEFLNYDFQRFSKFTKLHRVTAYILRFLNNSKPNSNKKTGFLCLDELKNSLKYLIKCAQKQSFHDDITMLSKRQHVDSKSKIVNLKPFLDPEGIIRVGGRLELSSYSQDKKHPIILHSKHPFTKLLFTYEHIRLYHAGPQLLLSSIREKYWPISGRNLARSVAKKCLTCFRFKPEYVQPVMGNLPADRAMPANPFHVTGIDYAGPFLIKRGRGSTREKCYIGLFVCLSTKALHLELISSLSTSSFMQALRRFVSRRGKPSKIISDNGTNFVGAHRELGLYFKSKGKELLTSCVNEEIDWQFIPPYTPHFGGLWEAGVKNVKFHLKRVLGNSALNFEDFCTLITQIEAILNSRPLSPMSSDPHDLCPLTPAHFLIGRPIIATPDENLQDIKVNRLTKYKFIQSLVQQFWNRWKREYVCELQKCTKWTQNRGHLQLGSLVLINDGQSLPTAWKLGRILKLHNGPDGVARVASIRTVSGIIKRSFPRICPLPIED